MVADIGQRGTVDQTSSLKRGSCTGGDCVRLLFMMIGESNERYDTIL